MQFKTMLSVLSVAVAASARPNPVLSSRATDPSCNSPQVLACCDVISTNGTGLGCLFSTLNLLDPTCTGSQSLACCSGSQTGLINIECIPVSVAL